MFLIKGSRSCFNEPYLCRNHIYIVAIVKFSNRSIQNLFNVDKGTCMDSRKLNATYKALNNCAPRNTRSDKSCLRSE